MFVFNVKVNGSKIFKIFFVGIVIFLIIILGIVVFKVFNGANNSVSSLDACIPQGGAFNIEAKNYTNILKSVHDNIDSYVGKKICFTGYVYRVLDLNDNQFVLARDMIINSNSQTVVVGFLCEYDDAKNLSNDSWIQITGEIYKGEYHGDMPIIKVTEIKNVEKPSQEECVYPPDDSYIPTTSTI